MSQKCEDPEVSDGKMYYTFARTLPPTSKITKSIVALLRAFEWNKVIVICGSRPTWSDHLKEYLTVELYNYFFPLKFPCVIKFIF